MTCPRHHRIVLKSFNKQPYEPSVCIEFCQKVNYVKIKKQFSVYERQNLGVQQDGTFANCNHSTLCKTQWQINRIYKFPHVKFHIQRNNTCNYHPQRSCEGYVFTPVCLSTGGEGEYLGRYNPQQVHPNGQVHTPRKVHPPGRYTSPAGTPPGRYTPWAGTSPGRYPPPSRRLLLRTVGILLECILVRYIIFHDMIKWSAKRCN